MRTLANDEISEENISINSIQLEESELIFFSFDNKKNCLVKT